MKVGLWGVSTQADAVALLRAVREAARRARWWWRAPTRTPGAWRTRRSRRSCCRASRARPASTVCLLDTAVKDGRGLLDWLSPDALTALVDEAHALGLEVALAGALRAEDLPVVRATGADIAGVRSAACGDGRRSGPLDAARVRALRAACAATRLRRARLGEPGDVQPVCARACAALADGGGDGVTPGRGGRPGARDQVIDALLRGLGLDQAAQAEADVPALVALDALRTLAHSGQRAVGQVRRAARSSRR